MQRRVQLEDLPGYAPDESPAPLQDEQADPEAVKAARGVTGTTQSVPPVSAP